MELEIRPNCSYYLTYRLSCRLSSRFG